MITGMLWFDNSPKTDLPAKIDRAAKYYAEKYGKTPNLCFVNPKMVGKSEPEQENIEVKTSEMVLPFHFWLGVAQEEGNYGRAFRFSTF